MWQPVDISPDEQAADGEPSRFCEGSDPNLNRHRLSSFGNRHSLLPAVGESHRK